MAIEVVRCKDVHAAEGGLQPWWGVGRKHLTALDSAASRGLCGILSAIPLQGEGVLCYSGAHANFVGARGFFSCCAQSDFKAKSQA